MNDAMVPRAFPLTLCLALCLAACSPRGSSVVEVAAPSQQTLPAAVPGGPPALTPPTEEEKDLSVRLRATVTHLAVEIGERNPGRSWNLASATDDLARTLEKMGFDVRRQGIVVGEDVVQNLEARSGGGERGGETVVVAAHFDTASGSPGANDGASGAAAVVELARMFRDRKTSRTLRFVLLSNGEAPYAGTEHTGSLVYAKDLVAQGVKVVGALCLDGIGVYRTEANSEHATGDLLSLVPSTADFVAVVGTEADRALLDLVSPSLKTATLKVTTVMVGPEAPIVAHSDSWGFAKVGFPTVTITDTGPLRYAHHHEKTDLPGELDFDRMARLVAAVSRALTELGGS